MVVLGTDHMSLLERGDDVLGSRIRSRLQALRLEGAVTTVISYEEQTRGWMAELSKARTLSKLVEVYGKLSRHLENYRILPVLDFDGSAARIFQTLRNQRVRIGTMDLRIASIVLAHDATLLSRNLVDFRKVPGLAVEAWTA